MVNLELVTDIRAAAVNDGIEGGCNYRSVSKSIIRMVEASAFFTVEKLTTEIARLILENYPVEEVTVSVEKPGALRFAWSVGGTITGNRKDFT